MTPWYYALDAWLSRYVLKEEQQAALVELMDIVRARDEEKLSEEVRA